MTPELLLIDDDVRVLGALGDLLRSTSMGVVVTTASSADAALALINEHDYDAIVCDFNMPDVDGLTLMPKIHECRPDTPILLMTGQNDQGVGVQALNAGAYACIPTPIDTDVFIAWLTRAIQVRALSRDVQEKTRRLERHAEIMDQAVHERTAHLQAALEALNMAQRGNRHLAALVESSEDAIISKLESAGDGIYGLDLQGHSTFVNPAAARLLGWTMEELRGTSMHAQVHHSHPDGSSYPADECPIYAALRDGHVHAVDSEVFWTKDGRPISVDYVTTPIWNAGRIQGAVVVFKDITERKRTEEHIRKLLSEAEARERQLVDKQAQLVQAAKLASIGELATGIAHEINNPLNNIALFLGNAIDRLAAAGDHDAVVSNLKKAEDQVRRAEAIITHLRSFGRLSSPHREPISINDVIQSAVSFVAEVLRVRNISVQLDLSLGHPVVPGNRIQLEQVFVNLLTNARDAVEGTARKAIAITTRIAGPFVEVVFVDTGTGIPAELLPRIFDPFFTTKLSGHGTGLGLSISYGILKDHHGEIEVESRIG